MLFGMFCFITIDVDLGGYFSLFLMADVGKLEANLGVICILHNSKKGRFRGRLRGYFMLFPHW
jgi:hypothetical protein